MTKLIVSHSERNFNQEIFRERLRQELCCKNFLRTNAPISEETIMTAALIQFWTILLDPALLAYCAPLPRRLRTSSPPSCALLMG